MVCASTLTLSSQLMVDGPHMHACHACVCIHHDVLVHISSAKERAESLALTSLLLRRVESPAALADCGSIDRRLSARQPCRGTNKDQTIDVLGAARFSSCAVKCSLSWPCWAWSHASSERCQGPQAMTEGSAGYKAVGRRLVRRQWRSFSALSVLPRAILSCQPPRR